MSLSLCTGLFSTRDLSAGSQTSDTRLANSDQAQPDSTPEATNSSRQPATVLLITAESLAKAWQPFADWKTSLGKQTRIVTVASIAKNRKGATIQDKIRACVRDHIENHDTRWVILGGDCLPDGGLVPGGPRTMHRQEPKGIPTDIIYLSPTNWDADGDGIYGEFRDDREAITYPSGKVGLGRIPVRTPADVAAFTEKVIAYEANYPTDAQFATRMTYTCTDSPAYPKVRSSWDRFVSPAWQAGDVQRFFSKETPWDEEGKPGSYPLSANNLVRLFNQKSSGKIHIHGHGHLPAWVLEGSRFRRSHVDELKHAGAYPLITTVSCNTGEFDSRKDPSIVEAMLRRPRGGSVAIVAPIRTGKPHFHSRRDFMLMVREGKLDGTTQTMTRYWVHGLGGRQTTGESLMKAKAQMAGDAKRTAGYHLCICELNLLGDPTLGMRPVAPRVPSCKVPNSVTIGAAEVTVVTDAPGATVCAQMGQEVYVVGQTGDDGRAQLKFETRAAGKLQIRVSGPGLNVWTGEVPVQIADGAASKR